MMVADDVAIKVDGVYKTFKLPHEKQGSVKGLFVSMFHGVRSYERQQVLRGVSFEVKKGEFFGIVGRNGSGKSTLLKLLAGIYAPNKGAVQVNGKLTPFIELGVGFNPELTGRENIYLNGALLGFSRKDMDAMYDEIVSFAELQKFMDQKLKNYSSGMQVRLAFSIAIRTNTDILLLDEVLAVGDEAFQRKCYEYFAKLKKEKHTVIFVSHDMNAVKNFCTQAILVDKGKIIAQGPSAKIATQYSKLNSPGETTDDAQDDVVRWGDGGVSIDKVEVSRGGTKKKAFVQDEPMEISFTITSNENLSDVVVGTVIQNAYGHPVFATNSQEKNVYIAQLKAGKKYEAVFSLPRNIYTNGTYTVSGAVANRDRSRVFCRVEEITKFTVSGWPMAHALAHPEHSFKLREK